jgi:RNA polymerase sigma factor (sigma-70 family)
MTNGRIGTVLWHVCRLVAARHADSTPDRGLLERFVASRDEAAFEALVRRYGPMVYGVCRRVLRHPEDTEDAFQAAFLVLARQAAAVRKSDSLGSWLHGVAYRVAANLRRDLARRRSREAVGADPPESAAAAEVSWQDVRVALDEELARLPERFQAPLVLCYLEGKTRDEAARELGWSVGTLRGRLERGRDLLRSRLTRRGLGLSAALLGAALTQDASAAVPATLIGAAAKVAAGAVPPLVAALAGGVLRTMFVAKVRTVAVLLFAVMAIGTAGVVLYQAATAGSAKVGPRVEAAVGEAPVAKPEAEAAPLAPVPAADDFGAEVKGLRAKVTLAKAKFALGEAIEVKYVVKNDSKEEQTVWHSGFWSNHLILVKDADGKEPDLTDFGKALRKAFSPGGERGKSAPVKVPAGGEDPAYENYDVTWLYNISKSGRYTVQYIYEEKQGGWEGRLPSNEAAFEFDASEKKDRTTEKDGVRFELLVPNATWTMPEANFGAPIALGLRITNGTKKAYRFSAQDTLIPEVKGPDGKTFELVVGEVGTALRREADCPLVEPGSSVVFMLDAALYRMADGQLRLRANRGSNQWVMLDDAKSGRYKIRVSYRNEADVFNANADRTVLKNVWTGDVPTPFVEVTVAKPETAGDKEEGYAASKAVRTGDVEFQAVVQKKRLVAEPGIQRSIDRGVRFTNRGDKPLTFSVFGTMRPTLKTADGKALRVDGGRDDAARRREPIVVAAGKSESVRWRARLESPDDGKSFRLAWTDGTGMSWYFDDVRSGKYLLSFEYDHSKNHKFWTGKATTNDVEIEVVTPEGAKDE